MKTQETRIVHYSAIDHSAVPPYISQHLTAAWKMRRDLKLGRAPYIAQLEKLATLLNSYIETEKSKIKK